MNSQLTYTQSQQRGPFTPLKQLHDRISAHIANPCYNPNVLFACLLITLLATGCSVHSGAPATPYIKAETNSDYGYSDTQLSENSYRVMYKASVATTVEKARAMTLKRAAAIGQSKGFQWMRIIDSEATTAPEVEELQPTAIIETTQNDLPQNRQCTMSGCEPVAQPFASPTNKDLDSNVEQPILISIAVTFYGDKPASSQQLYFINDVL